VEVYGGRANVLASDVREWLEGLWQGRALAFTVASLSALLAAVVFIALTPLPPRVDRSGTRQGDDRRPASSEDAPNHDPAVAVETSKGGVRRNEGS